MHYASAESPALSALISTSPFQQLCCRDRSGRRRAPLALPVDPARRHRPAHSHTRGNAYLSGPCGIEGMAACLVQPAHRIALHTRCGAVRNVQAEAGEVRDLVSTGEPNAVPTGWGGWVEAYSPEIVR